MICYKLKHFLLVCFGLIFVCLFLVSVVVTQSQHLVLETEQHWDTYGVGGTCISGTNNFAVSDVDNDGYMEMITGGFSYGMDNGTRTSLGAPFKIWGWNGSGNNLTLEKNESWVGSISCVAAGDANGDGNIEIITSGRAVENNTIISSLRFWSWNGEDLVSKGHFDGIPVSSIFIGDLNYDNTPEVVTVGRVTVSNYSVAQLNIWNWYENNLTLDQRIEWSGTSGAHANSVTAGDLNNDGIIEIVTSGYVNPAQNSSGHLCVWTLDNEGLRLSSASEWRLTDGYAVDVTGNNVMGNTMVYNVELGDVDGDGFLEIVTGGFTYNGENACAQLRVWNWTGQNLGLETSLEWSNLDITEIKSITLNDVDGDGKKEIITSGVTAGEGSWLPDASDKSRAELGIWKWDGVTLSLQEKIDWISGEGACAWNLGAGDVDGNGDVEIVTVGCMYTNDLCDPDLRIWRVNFSSSNDDTLGIIIAFGIGAIILVIVVTLVKTMKKPNKHEG